MVFCQGQSSTDWTDFSRTLKPSSFRALMSLCKMVFLPVKEEIVSRNFWSTTRIRSTPYWLTISTRISFICKGKAKKGEVKHKKQKRIPASLAWILKQSRCKSLILNDLWGAGGRAVVTRWASTSYDLSYCSKRKGEAFASPPELPKLWLC